MKSVRLGEKLEADLAAAARVAGRTTSELIRDAVRAHCDWLLGRRLDRALGDYVGAIARGGNARRSGRQFADLLRRRDTQRRAKRRRASGAA